MSDQDDSTPSLTPTPLNMLIEQVRNLYIERYKNPSKLTDYQVGFLLDHFSTMRTQDQVFEETLADMRAFDLAPQLTYIIPPEAT